MNNMTVLREQGLEGFCSETIVLVTFLISFGKYQQEPRKKGTVHFGSQFRVQSVMVGEKLVQDCELAGLTASTVVKETNELRSLGPMG